MLEYYKPGVTKQDELEFVYLSLQEKIQPAQIQAMLAIMTNKSQDQELLKYYNAH